MAQCPGCGKKIGLVFKINCSSCGVKYCTDCGDKFLAGTNVEKTTENGNTVLKNVPVMVAKCKNCLAKQEAGLVTAAEKANPFGFCPACGLEDVPTKYRLNQEYAVKFDFPNGDTFTPRMLSLEAYCPKCSKVYSRKYLWSSGKPHECSSDFDDPSWYNISQARLAESVGRIEDAALFYEKAGQLAKARELNKRSRSQVVQHVTVDVNKLLDFLRENSFTIPYKCPSCLATIRINGQRDATQFFTCEYCGTSLQAIDVQNLIGGLM